MTNPNQPLQQPQQPQAPYQQPVQPYAPQPYQQPVQPYAPQPYQQPGYGPAYGSAATPPTNTLAIVSLVSSLATFVLGFTAIVGVITGHMALGQIRRTGESGRGMALAGLIIGYVFVGFTVLAIVFFVVAMVLGLFVPLAVLSGTSGSGLA